MAGTLKLEDIQAAAERIKGKATYTPVLTSTTMNKRSGLDLHFKCEAFQKGTTMRRIEIQEREYGWIRGLFQASWCIERDHQAI